MKKVLKITIILIILIATIGQMNSVYADIQTELTDSGGGRALEGETLNPDFYNPATGENGGENTEFNRIIGIILGAIRAVGILVSIGALLVIGIRTMLGSAQEKSVYKESLPGYIIGAFLVMAITTLPSIVYEIASKW